MAVMFAKLYRALKDAGASEEVASAAAEEMAGSLATAQAVGHLEDEFKAFRTDVRSEFAKVRSEMAGEFTKVRSEMAGEFTKVRSEMAGEFAKVRSEIDAVRKDVGQLKTDSAVLKWMVGFVLALVVAVLGLLLRGLA